MSSFLSVVTALAAICLVAASAEAGFLAQLEGLQNVNGAIRQYKFEGQAAGSQRNDSGSQHVDLLPALGEGGSGTTDPDGVPNNGDEINWSYPAGDVNLIGFEAGFDGAGVSQAYRPQSVPVTASPGSGPEALSQRRSGAGFYTQFTTPNTMTVEAVIRPDAYVDTAGGPHYIFQTRPGAGRGYYLSQVAPLGSRGTNGRIAAIVGSDFNERPSVLPDYSDQSHWYYVAVTFDLSGTNAVINSYMADLTTGGPLTATQAPYGFVATIGAGLVNTSGNAGIGLFSRNTDLNTDGINDAQEFFYGSIDNLAIYGSILTPDQIARHHRALTVPGVPEPASCVMLALAGVALGVFRRRAS